MSQPTEISRQGLYDIIKYRIIGALWINSCGADLFFIGLGTFHSESEMQASHFIGLQNYNPHYHSVKRASVTCPYLFSTIGLYKTL